MTHILVRPLLNLDWAVLLMTMLVCTQLRENNLLRRHAMASDKLTFCTSVLCYDLVRQASYSTWGSLGDKKVEDVKFNKTRFEQQQQGMSNHVIDKIW